MLCEHKKCTGCMACVQICAKNAVKMQKESDGFWYPTVNVEKCVNCGACTRVCPMENEISVLKMNLKCMQFGTKMKQYVSQVLPVVFFGH